MAKLCRYYISAYNAAGLPILGNLDGQAALGEVRRPTQCQRWKHLFEQARPRYSRVHTWKIETSCGTVVATYINPHHQNTESVR